jgi:pimeloyl-ACP methyl ester carboxylesterase
MAKRNTNVDPTRRSLLATGAAAAAVAAVKRAFGQQRNSEGDSNMAFYENGDVRIHYEVNGSGFPLLMIAGGGLNSVAAYLTERAPFNPIAEFGDEFTCVSMDLRNANGGSSTGPLEIDRPWDSYTDDQLGLMDHLGFEQFMVLGFCIGGPFIWNLLERAGNRIPAAVLAQPSGYDPNHDGLFYNNNMTGWGPDLVARRPDLTMEMVDAFLTKMYVEPADFVFTVSRDFVRQCQTPILVLPDDIPAHPYEVAMETVLLSPNAEVSLYPWKEPAERVPLAVRHIHSFMTAHRPDAG